MLCAAIGIVYFYGAGAMPLVGPDEPRYAQVAREMFERNDLVTPTLGGLTWFEKPALLYWLMIAAYHLFGVSEWAARLPSALAGVLTIAAVAWLARRVERAMGEQEAHHFAIVTTSIAASSLGLVVFAHGASFDVIIVAAIAWTLAFFFAADEAKDAGERRRMLCAMYACVGFGLLAKGLVGIVIPGFVVALYFLIGRRLPARAMWWSLAWGTLVAALVAGVWYAPVMREHGEAFVNEFFLQHHFARYTSNKYRHPQRFYFYIPITLLLLLPWTLCLVAVLARVRLWSRRSSRDDVDARARLRFFGFAWLVAPVLFFSASGSKLPGYVLPALPGAALLIGEWLTRRGGEQEAETSLLNRRRILQATGGGMILLACGGALFAAYKAEAGALVSALIALPIALAGYVVVRNARRTGLAVASITGATFLSVLLAVLLAGMDAGGQRSTRELLREATARGYTQERVYGLYMLDRTAEFYAAGRVAYDADGEPVIFDSVNNIVELVGKDRTHGDRPAAVLVMTFPDTLHHITRNSALATEVVAVNKRAALARITRK